MDAAPAAHDSLVAVIKVLQAVQVVEIPADARVLAVDFEGVERLVAACIARALEERERAVGEMPHERAGVVNLHLLHLAAQRVLALLDESLRHRRHVRQRAVQPDCRVNAVREQIARHAAACGLRVETPQARAALREVGGNRPVLEEVRAVVENFAEFAGINDLLRQRHSRHAAIIIPNRIRHLRRLDHLHHLLALRAVERERLFAKHHLARARRRHRDFSVAVVRRADVNRINVLAGDELFPIRLRALKSPVVRVGFQFRLVATASGLEHGFEREIKKVRRVVVCVRVGAAHEAVADDADVQVFLCHNSR